METSILLMKRNYKYIGEYEVQNIRKKNIEQATDSHTKMWN